MNWKELKDQVIDLGFEEDDTYTEYSRVIINASNRALQILYSTVIPQISDYLKGKWGKGYTDANGKEQWIYPTRKTITTETNDEDKIFVPTELDPLVPLLAAHYIWLDDDLTKATIYWNEYDDLKQQILATYMRPRGCVIEGGW